MVYIERALERKFLHMADYFKVVLVTGARQVGKTTMLKHLAEGEDRTYVTMDHTMSRILAKRIRFCFFRPTSRRLSLMRYKKHRNCSNRSKLCVTKRKNGDCSG